MICMVMEEFKIQEWTMASLTGIDNVFYLKDKYAFSVEDKKNSSSDFSAYMAAENARSETVAEMKTASAEKIAAHNAGIIAAIDVRDPKQQFLDFMEGTSEEVMREQILLSMGLTEEELEALPAEERIAIEKKIAAIIREKMQLSLEQEVSGGVGEKDRLEG